MENISVTELKNKLENGEQLHIIDVREQDEYDAANIGAVLLPLSQINVFDTEAIDHLKDQTLYIHCRSGVRSVQAAQFLSTMGFNSLVNVEGGINAWKEAFGDKKISDVCPS